MFGAMNLDSFLVKLPEAEATLTEALLDIVKDYYPDAKIKLAYGVPYFYLRKRVCFVWPTSIPRSGVQHGVLLGFCFGNDINDPTGKFKGLQNKYVRFAVYEKLESIRIPEIQQWLIEARVIDLGW